MSDRLTDEKVALYVDMGNYPATSCASDDVIALAREVQEYRALRPTCPTCLDGLSSAVPTTRCPDCENGKMPLAEWVALLVNTLDTVRDALDLTGLWVRRLAQADAVLKMAGKS